MHSHKSGCMFSLCFLSSHGVVQLYLPKNEKYAPPLNFHVHEKGRFGLTPLVGSHSIMSVHNPDYHPGTRTDRSMFMMLECTIVTLDMICFSDIICK